MGLLPFFANTRRTRLAVWIALLSTGLAVLIPTMTRLVLAALPAHVGIFVEVCTQHGVRLVAIAQYKADSNEAPAPSVSGDFCPYCTFTGMGLALKPAEPRPVLVAHGRLDRPSHSAPAVRSAAVHPYFFARAPPSV